MPLNVQAMITCTKTITNATINTQTERLPILNLLGLYDKKNHIYENSRSFEIKVRNKRTANEPKSIASGAKGNSNTIKDYTSIPVTGPRHFETIEIKPRDILDNIDTTKPLKEQTKEALKLIGEEGADIKRITEEYMEIYAVKAMQNESYTYKEVQEDNETIVEKTITITRNAENINDVSADEDLNFRTGNPLKTIASAEKPITKSGFKANVIILGEEAADDFEANEYVIAKLNNRNQEGINAKLEELGIDQFEYLGFIKGKKVYKYVGEYMEDDTSVSHIDKQTMIMTSTAMPWKIHFGEIEDNEAIKIGRHKGVGFANSWPERNPSRTMMSFESNGLPVPTVPNAIVAWKVSPDAVEEVAA